MEKNNSVLIHLIEILESIESDLMLALRVHERENRGGFLSISRQVFCYLDYLGALAADGKNTSDNAVAFMVKYLAQINPEYSGKCKLLYYMWRQGTVHEYDPKVISSINEQFYIHWGANNSSKLLNRKWHLKCLCNKGKPNHYRWFINLFVLVEDLQASIKHFISDLESDEGYLSKVKDNYTELSKEINLDSEKILLLPEAKALISLSAGVIDQRLQVIKEFTTSDEFNDFKKSWIGD